MIERNSVESAYKATIRWQQLLYNSAQEAEKSISRTLNVCKSSLDSALEGVKNKVPGADTRLERARANYAAALKQKEVWWVVNATLELIMKKTLDEASRAAVPQEFLEWADTNAAHD